MICSGTITVSLLGFIDTRLIQMSKLCEAVAIPSDKVTIDSHEKHSSGIPPFALLNHYLTLRLSEFHHFTDYKIQMRYLMNHLQSIEVTG